MAAFLRFIMSEWWGHYRKNRLLQRRFPSIRLWHNVQIIGPPDNLKLGQAVEIQSNVVLHLGGQEWCRFSGSLQISDNACLSPNVVIYAAGPGGVRIGKNFDCGPGVGIFSSRTDIEQAGAHVFAPVVIGDNVTLFANVVVSPGVRIGNNVVVAANSVVTRDLPDNCFAGGAPARIIRQGIRNT